VPQKLLILLTDLEIGGTPTVVRELSTRLAQRGHDVQVACLATRGPVADEIEQRGVHVTALGATGIHSLSVLPRLIRLIRDHQITTVYSLLVHANTIAAIASLFCRSTRFIQSIQTTQLRPRWHWPIQSIAAQAAEKIIVPSESVAAVARYRADVPPEKLVIIPNAIDIDSFKPDPEIKGDTTLYIKGRVPFNAGFIGRLDPIKRVPDLIEAAGRLRDSINLHIYGDGPDRGRIESAIARLHLSNVTLHGQIARPQEALRELDLLVLASEAEGFGLVLIEAMAARVPVIGTNVPGIWDIIANESTGLLVPVASPEKLAAAITRLLSDTTLRRTLVENAYTAVAQRFAWPPVITEYEKILLH
jgi:glycosyltransferase involved in cell wall biosynthesis